MRERDIEAKFRAICQSLGWMCIKLMQTSVVGIPDRLVITSRGVMVFVELKSPTGKVSAIQAKTHQLLTRHNALVLVGYEPTKLAAAVALYAGEYETWQKLSNAGYQKPISGRQ